MGNKYSGVLCELFPGYAKKWYEYLGRAFRTHRSQVNYGYSDSDEIPIGIWLKGVQNLTIPDFDPKFTRMLAKHGLKPGEPLEGVAQLLRATKPAKYSHYSNETYSRAVRLPSWYGSDLEDYGRLLMSLPDMVVGSLPVEVRISGDTVIMYKQKLVYKDDLAEIIQGGHEYLIGRLLHEEKEIHRDLLHYKDPRVEEAYELLGLDATSDSYMYSSDPRRIVLDRLKATGALDVVDLQQDMDNYRKAVLALEVLIKTAESPAAERDPVEIFKDIMPALLATDGAMLRGCSSGGRGSACRLAAHILEDL